MVPDTVRHKALAGGDACRRWLADLGELIAELEQQWDLRVGATFDGGTASFVAEAVTADGTAAVIKLAMPAEMDGRVALENEVRTLLVADGRACVRVLNHDAEKGAVLLERLGRQLIELGLPVFEQMRIICSLLRVLWAVPCQAPLPSLDRKGRWLAEIIASTWEELGRPCSTQVVERAVSYAERRSSEFDPHKGVLVHGDAHSWNTLEDMTAASPGAFKLVDPDGLLAEPEYDLAILMREFTDELLAGDALKVGQDRARFLARLTGLDEQRIWEWGFVERVSNGLLCIKDGLGRDCLSVAELWSAAP
jgi:streptomycin 6-kinase